MKAKISVLFVMLTYLMGAQFNNTYDINGNNDYLFPQFVIPTSDLGSASVSWAVDAPSWPRTDYFILTKHDATGNVIFNERFNPINTPNDGFTHVKALLEADDKGILIAGYYFDASNFATMPFLMKVDANGVYQWTKIYYVSSDMYIGYQFDKLSICRVEDDPDETYFIVTSAQSDARPVNDAAICVTKVKADGSMIWNKKYYDTNLFGNPYGVVRDCPGDIAFSKDHKMYMITGWRQQWVWFQEDRIFFFGIDKDGNALTPYKSLDVPGYPFGEDMIYDPNTKNWAVTYTHGNTNYSGNPLVASGIGLVVVDAGLNVVLDKFYWDDKATENYGVSISLCDNGDYVIGSFMYEEGGSPIRRNPALLKVDNMGNPFWLHRYNVKDDAIFGHHCMSHNPNTGIEEYVLIAEQNNDMRVIRTDIGGDVCGVRDYIPNVLDVFPKEEWFKYDFKDNGDYKEYDPKIWDIAVNYRKCFGSGSSYRSAEVTGIENISADSESLDVYPSTLSKTNALLSVNNNSGETLNLLVTDVTGKEVLRESTIAEGKGNVLLNKNANLSEGVYMVKFYSNDGSFSTTKKVIIGN